MNTSTLQPFSKRSVAMLLPLLSAFACNDLDVPAYDKVADFWLTPGQIEQGVAQAYVQFRSYAPGFQGDANAYYLQEATTDEIIVPVRAGNWIDGGYWEELWKHQWTPNSQSVQDGWKFIFNGVDGINLIVQSLKKLPDGEVKYRGLIAEMRTLRAFYYYQALDLFGSVPIVEEPGVSAYEVATRSREEVFAYVERELKENLPLLTSAVNVETYGRATQWLVHALLAKLYLNAEVYTGKPRWADCVAACDAILNSGMYVLEDDFFKNFAVNNESSRENIFAIPFDFTNNMGYFVIQLFTLHYKSGATFGLDGGGSNGPCSTAEYLSLFDDNDRRREMFLVGQQYVGQIEDVDHMQFTDETPPVAISFDPVITSFHIDPPKAQVAGARCAKWEFNKTGWHMSNDFAVFRLADIILMKGEAQFRSGDVAAALNTINQKAGNVSIRSRASMPDFSMEDLNLEGLLAERARELSWEGHRRNDMIRFGHFTDVRIPEKDVSESYRTVFPIPKAEIDKNKYLLQNPGY
ncbi:MAG TPA: RagB/SusD family nutrient uptake outer membrane protein [Chryseolinea sp.]|nr:RagB/SusD family nutrient uptake outer membrane protein [Chryseolinea sp.]